MRVEDKLENFQKRVGPPTLEKWSRLYLDQVLEVINTLHESEVLKDKRRVIRYTIHKLSPDHHVKRVWQDVESPI